MKRYVAGRADKEYQGWQKSDKRIFAKINDLVDSIEENGMLKGKGKPKQLKHFNEPTYSRRITGGDRLVYRPYNENDLLILSCKGHYEDS
jgi:toxin YoeB